MPWTCSHGTRIYCESSECGLCMEEEAAWRRDDEQMEVLRRIADKPNPDPSLEGENRRLREEIERLKKSR